MPQQLVRSSSFCRPYSVPNRTPEHVVVFRILPQTTSLSNHKPTTTTTTTTSTNTNHQNSNSLLLGENALVIYSSSIDVLRSVGLHVGCMAWITVARRTIAVRVRLITTTRTTTTTIGTECPEDQVKQPSEDTHPHPTSFIESVQLLRQQSHSHTQQNCIIHVPPLTALNLGWDYGDNDDERKVSSLKNGIEKTLTGVLTSNFDSLQLVRADHVMLRMLGQALPTSLLNVQQQEEKGAESCEWPLPAVGQILQADTIIAVSSNPLLEGHERCTFYQVLEVNESFLCNERCCYVSTSQTIYRWSNQDTSISVPRLPPLSSSSSSSLPHPDIAQLKQSLQSQPFSIQRHPQQLIHHMIGTEDDHHVITALRAVASRMGRNCFVMPGLAAMTYLSSDSDSPNITGTISDQLNGMQAGLDWARQHAPCLLIVPNLMEEFRSNDESQRKDLEERLWNVCMEYFRHWDCQKQCVATNLPQVPAVTIVFLTPKPLLSGPILQNLVWESLRLSYPNATYIAYLWDTVVTSMEMISLQNLLVGRSVREILELRRSWQHAIEENERTGDIGCDREGLLRRLCDLHDKRRRKDLAHIPSIYWTDVGGLVSVRQEIMDAIELPLQYPHLFTAGAGHSNILLYGAPGTGKTLVAKAVATECGLPFLSVKGPELLGSYVGESESQVRNVFARARQLASQNHPPASILFFDELDSLAPRRGNVASGGNIMDRVVATIFVEMDRVKESLVFCMAATNRPDLVDPSLLRHGRFDRLVYLGVSTKDNVKILETQMRHLRLEGDAQEIAMEVAKLLPRNLTGADLSTVVSGGLLQATDRLCREADRQALKMLQDPNLNEVNDPASRSAHIDQVLQSWTDDELEPVVKLDDFLVVARTVAPSVSLAELDNYEKLRDQYQMNVT